MKISLPTDIRIQRVASDLSSLCFEALGANVSMAWDSQQFKRPPAKPHTYEFPDRVLGSLTSANVARARDAQEHVKRL